MRKFSFHLIQPNASFIARLSLKAQGDVAPSIVLAAIKLKIVAKYYALLERYKHKVTKYKLQGDFSDTFKNPKPVKSSSFNA